MLIGALTAGAIAACSRENRADAGHREDAGPAFGVEVLRQDLADRAINLP
ncbi:hypothetical protein AB0D34_25910 [Streptomyces sp. NPDC048420]